jgi:hypothetical protein
MRRKALFGPARTARVHHGVLKLRLGADGYVGFLPVTGDGLRDKGSAGCNRRIKEIAMTLEQRWDCPGYGGTQRETSGYV